MPDTIVVNVKHDRFDVYIGRANPRHKLPKSKWGNPFMVGKDGTRAEVIAKYRDYVLSRPDLLAALPELRGQRLGCWCKPLACHGDVLVELVNQMEDADHA